LSLRPSIHGIYERRNDDSTFIVGKDGVVYQKDLGEKTGAIAEAMTVYDPGDDWKPAI
jgi:hypothetical protein